MINPKKTYSLSQIHREKFFYWIKDYEAYRNAISMDRYSGNHLKAVIVTRPFHVSYKIKGENIIKYLANQDEIYYEKRKLIN